MELICRLRSCGESLEESMITLARSFSGWSRVRSHSMASGNEVTDKDMLFSEVGGGFEESAGCGRRVSLYRFCSVWESVSRKIICHEGESCGKSSINSMNCSRCSSEMISNRTLVFLNRVGLLRDRERKFGRSAMGRLSIE